MGWFGKSDQEAPAKAEATIQPVTINGELAGLNLKQVLEAHQDWKAKLQKVLDGESEDQLEPKIVSADNHCVLGKWLYSEGKVLYGHLPEYETTRLAHAEFHLCAGEVVLQHLAGNKRKATLILTTKFRSASNKNQMLLTNLFRVAKTR